MGTQGTHENSIEDMVKWTLGHSKCERPATGGYHTLGSAVSQFGPYLKGKYFYHFMQPQIFWGEININISQCIRKLVSN